MDRLKTLKLVWHRSLEIDQGTKKTVPDYQFGYVRHQKDAADSCRPIKINLVLFGPQTFCGHYPAVL